MGLTSSNIVNGFRHLRQAKEFFDVAVLDDPKSSEAKKMKDYSKRLDWFRNDLVCHPFLSEHIRSYLKVEWDSDVFTFDDIVEKLPKITTEQREILNVILDRLIAGETLKFVPNEK